MSEHDAEIQDVMDKLATIAPAAIDEPRPAPQTLAWIKQTIEAKDRQPYKWRFESMFKKKYAFATLFVVLLIVVALSFPAVRAAASDFLGLFRVDKFAPISISPEQLALLEEVAESGFYPGEIEMIEELGAPQIVGSLAEAEAKARLQARLPSTLAEPDSVYFLDGGQGRLIVNVENARSILEIAGADPALIPDTLNGEAVDVKVYPAVSLNWNAGIVLLQSPSPLVEYPEDIDVAALGKALLQILGMEPEQAERIANSIDWTSTLLVPIPENMATFDEIQIDGVSGLALSSLDGNNAAVLWQKLGTIYVLSGPDIDQLVDIANSLR